MYTEKWSIFTLQLSHLEAAKKGERIVCPDPLLGTKDRDQVSFELPTYQRGLVWTPKHGEQFQQALKNGWPIGQLVLAEKAPVPLPGGSGLLREYQLIDGQQRTFWLNKTRDRFFVDHHYSLADVRLTQSLAALAAALSVTVEEISEAIQAWTSKSTFSPSHLRDVNFLLHHLIAELDILPLTSGDPAYTVVSESIVVINDEIARQYRDLSELGVPILLIRQELQDELHEIFQRLNEGTSLSDLDLLAADWRFLSVDILAANIDQTLKDQLITLAQQRISATYDQESYEYDPDLVELKAEDMSLFDLLYALGRYAARKYPKTFQGIGNSSDRLAIFVAALVFGGGIGRRKDLRRLYPNAHQAATLDATLFPTLFLAACREIDGAFSKLNSVDAGKRLRGRLGLIQAATYIANYICLVGRIDGGSGGRLAIGHRTTNADGRLERDPVRVLSATQRKDAFKRNLVGWFLADSLSELFQGSDAYAAAAARVWSELDPEHQRFIVNEDMLFPVDQDRIGRELVDRFWRELDVTATPKQRRYSEPGSVIMRVAYAGTTSTISGEEIDHVIPFDARMGRSFPVPINHAGNLMTLRKALNSSRRERYLTDYFVDPKVTSDVKAEVLARLFVPVDHASDKALDDLSSFRKMLAARWLELTRRVLVSVNHPNLVSDPDVDRFLSEVVEPGVTTDPASAT